MLRFGSDQFWHLIQTYLLLKENGHAQILLFALAQPYRQNIKRISETMIAEHHCQEYLSSFREVKMIRNWVQGPEIESFFGRVLFGDFLRSDRCRNTTTSGCRSRSLSDAPVKKSQGRCLPGCVN